MDFGKLLRRKSLLVGASAIAVITVVALPLANAASVITTAPTGFTVTAGPNYSAQLHWNKVSGATGYVIAYSTTKGGQNNKTSVGSGTTSTSISPLNSNATYYFELWATPAKSGGPHAGPIGVKISNDPTVGSGGPWVTTAPTNFHVISVGSNFIQVGWNSVPHATSYSVNYSTTSSFQRNTNVCVVVGNSAIFDTYNVGGAYGTTARLQPNTTYNIQLWGNPIKVDASPHASLSVKTAAAGSSATEPHGQCGSNGSTPTSTSTSSSSSSSSSTGFVGDAPSKPSTTSTTSTSTSTSSSSSASSGTFVNDFGMTVSAPSASSCAQIKSFISGYSC